MQLLGIHCSKYNLPLTMFVSIMASCPSSVDIKNTAWLNICAWISSCNDSREFNPIFVLQICGFNFCDRVQKSTTCKSNGEWPYELIEVVPGIHNRAKSTKSSHIHSVINIHIPSIIRRLAHTLITPLCIVRNSYLVTSKLYIWPSYITYSFNNVRAQKKTQETFSNSIKKIIAWWRYLMRRMKINKDGYKLRILCEMDIGGSTFLKKIKEVKIVKELKIIKKQKYLKKWKYSKKWKS